MSGRMYALVAFSQNMLFFVYSGDPIMLLSQILFAPKCQKTYLASSRSHSSLQLPIRVLMPYL